MDYLTMQQQQRSIQTRTNGLFKKAYELQKRSNGKVAVVVEIDGMFQMYNYADVRNWPPPMDEILSKNPKRKLPSDYQTLRDASESGDLLNRDGTNPETEGTPASDIVDHINPMAVPHTYDAELHNDVFGYVTPTIEYPSEPGPVREVANGANYDTLDNSIFAYESDQGVFGTHSLARSRTPCESYKRRALTKKKIGDGVKKASVPSLKSVKRVQKSV